MEAESSHPSDGERSGRQEQPLSDEPPPGSRPPHPPPPNPRPVHGALGRPHHRQPRRGDLLLRMQQHRAPAPAWQASDAPGPSAGCRFPSPSPSSGSPVPSSTTGCPPHGGSSQAGQEGSEGASQPRRGDKKPPKPGKYICTYCGRPCAKPSVLQKHIRSHTGERPYPCAPCGFSFKTKSNLYKHRKSHAHRIKAGLASSRDEPSLSGPEAQGEDPEEPTEGESTDSEEETGRHQASSVAKERQGQQKSGSVGPGPEESHRPEDSQAVKQRLAMRLSERKRGPLASPDDAPSSSSTSSSSLGPGSKGSTESGYFSSYGSAELSQVSPPSANVKTYAEIILGKYGRRSPHQLHPHPHPHASSSGPEEKGLPFGVPKTQVIEHITKLITINEAVVDTSEIDSVKPRRSSLSRKSSLESPKFSSPSKDPYVFEPKSDAPGPSGLGAPCGPDGEPSGIQVCSTAVPLLRSHSMPTCASQGDPASCAIPPKGFRLSQSFDEQQAMVAEMRVGHAQRMLRRQPAIEMPPGAELTQEEAGPSSSFPGTGSEPSRRQQEPEGSRGPWLYECEACRGRWNQRDSYEAHTKLCPGQPIQEQPKQDAGGRAFRGDRPQMMHYKFRALAMAVRKRRKEESLEEDPPSPCSPAPPTSVPSRPEHGQTFSGAPSQADPQQQDRKGVSVIQHTSSFEKQESFSMESQEVEAKGGQPTQPPEPRPSPTTSRLVRQHNIQVPEILVTVEPDADMPSVSPPAMASSSKEMEKVEEFQWPQRSHSLSQLPAEKLPPKKKRLRLAEASQSSRESSFESVSLPRSPSQESSISHASSRSPSLEDPGKPEGALWGSGIQGSHMLTVPSASHPHHLHQPSKEMRRSASEQATASPESQAPDVETRSKSFDYGSLSPQQSASAWKERRKCLLVKHATLGEPEQDEGASGGQPPRNGSPQPGPSFPGHLGLFQAEAGTSRLNTEAIGKTLQLLQPQILPLHQALLPLRPQGQDPLPPGPLAQLLPATTAITEVLSTQIIHRAFLHTRSGPLQVHPAQLHRVERVGMPLHPFSNLLPVQFPSGVGTSQALYLPMPPGLTIQMPSHHPALREARPSTSSSCPAPVPHSLVPVPYNQHAAVPTIATCMEQLTPVVSLVVPVRLQTHVPTYTRAVYTTLSQILARSQDPIVCTAMVIMGQLEQDKLQRSYLKLPSPDFKSYLPLSLPLELVPSPGEDFGPLGPGGSKRMLSPAASLELSSEAQRQQKRVKEEEAKEEEVEEEEVEERVEERVEEEEEKSKGSGSHLETGDHKEELPKRVEGEVAAVKEEQEGEEVVPEQAEPDREEELPGKSEPKKEEVEEEVTQQASAPQPRNPEAREPPSYPCLHTSTSVSWCYLNYGKPNPSAQREPQASVYSSWSVSVHNPNLPGLSTRLALGLLRSKQQHSSETYTTATAPGAASSKLVPANSRKPRVSEVPATPPSASLRLKEQRKPEKDEQKKGKREEEGASTSKHSEAPPPPRLSGGGASMSKHSEAPPPPRLSGGGASTSKQSEAPPPPRLRIFEGGYKSNEDYVYVRGRGRGKYVCGECGIRCKKPSMLRKHIRTHTDLRPYVCKHCNFAFKTKGNLTKHMKSKAHGKKCLVMGVSGSSMEEEEPESETTGGDREEPPGGPEHQFSDVDDSDEEDDEDEEEESSSHDDPPSSCSSDTRPSTGGRSTSSGRSQHGPPGPTQEPMGPGPSQEASPRRLWPSGRASSPGGQRALFPRRGWSPSPRAFSPSSDSCSPARSLSPRLDLSSPSRHPSPSPERGPSPISTLSPLHPLSPLQPLSPSRYRTSLRARATPSPLGGRPRPSACLPWESPRTLGSLSQEGCGTPQLIPPKACLFPPALRLSLSESPVPPSPQTLSTCHLFSHLPMHSQQTRVPYPMIPIGGIQMVQARACSHPTTTSPSSPMERPSLGLGWREAPWGGTSRTRGLRTPGDHWSESQEAGSSQSGLRVSGTAPRRSNPETETADAKQYGSLHSSSHSHRSAAETTEPWPLGSPVEPPPGQSQVELSQGEEPPGVWPRSTGPGLAEGGSKGGASDSTNQSTY
ncbi:transcription factor HIVEP3 [Hypomesus transpacificus]|uniref:transcription factor HIVEP3 n=1 Tax=Hypomesus transpacificus TaxID=137520 RepID=UPI001F072678|nr:transcription factor HIVEP3 [Hypomesus transpacificus]XP_046891985.1 transcription factor HIVEP3 [Hypomesus transpacificus]XP_046891992.1 transcription factor HIVEP3 [Hypomesus transpacificus]